MNEDAELGIGIPAGTGALVDGLPSRLIAVLAEGAAAAASANGAAAQVRRRSRRRISAGMVSEGGGDTLDDTQIARRPDWASSHDLSELPRYECRFLHGLQAVGATLRLG